MREKEAVIGKHTPAFFHGVRTERDGVVQNVNVEVNIQPAEKDTLRGICKIRPVGLERHCRHEW